MTKQREQLIKLLYSGIYAIQYESEKMKKIPIGFVFEDNGTKVQVLKNTWYYQYEDGIGILKVKIL